MEFVDWGFMGFIFQFYECYMVLLIFQFYVFDLVVWVVVLWFMWVFEIVVGMGVLICCLVVELLVDIVFVVIDFNFVMLEMVVLFGIEWFVVWQQVDVMVLFFEDVGFDFVVCQFGVMFFFDWLQVYVEICCVFWFGGFFVFNVWDYIDSNELVEIVILVLVQVFLDDLLCFLVCMLYGYYDVD